MDMKIVTTFAILSLFTVSVWCNPCTKEHSVDITSGMILPDGSIAHRLILYEVGEWYTDEEDGKPVFRGCPCLKGLCIWKCCDDKQMFLQKTCKQTGIDELSNFNPPVYKGKDLLNVTDRLSFTVSMHSLKCNEKYIVDTSIDYEELFIQENGTLMEVTRGRSQWFLPSEYCVDMMTNNETQPARLVALICYPEESPEDDSPALYISYSVGLLLSVPFLIATFLVYVFIPDLRNLHGMCLMAYCAGLIVAYIFLAYLKIHIGKVGVTMTGCKVIAFIVYYAFQTSFFWLNVMCFDIWRTFSGYRGSSTTKRREIKRFAIYGAYAWGVPLLLTVCTAGMQSANLPPNIITPGFGDKKCWFSDWMSELVYFFTPVLILVVCNLVLFLVTAYRIRSIKQETSILKGSKSTNKLKQDKQRYTLYLKLFVVMGVNWTVELISFVVGGSNWYWILVDISNIMLGFFIFMIFVWKRKVRNLVTRRFRSFRGLPPTTSDFRKSTTGTSTAVTEESRLSEDPGVRLKDLN